LADDESQSLPGEAVANRSPRVRQRRQNFGLVIAAFEKPARNPDADLLGRVAHRYVREVGASSALRKLRVVEQPQMNGQSSAPGEKIRVTFHTMAPSSIVHGFARSNS